MRGLLLLGVKNNASPDQRAARAGRQAMKVALRAALDGRAPVLREEGRRFSSGDR